MAGGALSRLVPATAFALGAIRAWLHLVFLINVLAASFQALGRLPVTVMRPTGAMQFLPWDFYEALLTPGGMLALKVLLVVSLALGALGFKTPVTTKTSAALVLFYEGLLRSFGHFNHDEMVAVYALVVLAFAPCGDAFSLDAWRKKKRTDAPGWAYGYPVLLIRLLVAWMYFSSALIKLRVAGLKYFDPDNLPALSIYHSLDNLHDTRFRLAFLLPAYREYTPLVVGAVLLWELLFPLAVFSKRARPWLLGFGVIFHVSTVFAMNLFFPFHLAMYVVFLDPRAFAERLRANTPRSGD